MFPSETAHLTKSLGRPPTETELAIVSAEWSEHCSYKSSKRHIRTLPSAAPHVITGKGLDSGVIDVGDGYIVTAHIESHNHPSAVEPYGGAATGVGGIIRDIISAGTRPIAILDGLRFGEIDGDRQAAWMFRNAVRGISDYGNCLGIPTVGGEVGFDPCYAGYALVDVAAVGFGKDDRLIRNRADPGDHVILLGGPTGYDGVGGAQFASDSLETEERSAVQIPDPFIEKLVLEVILESRPFIKAVKDLGGGGLACAVSETADSLGVGITMDTERVHVRNPGMTPAEIMISESQERMLVITDDPGLEEIRRSCSKFRVPCSVIGKVDSTGYVTVGCAGETLARMPAGLVANAPLLDWPAAPQTPPEDGTRLPPLDDYSDALIRLLAGPHCSSRKWAYSQYDHEVGIRTVVRPGLGASLLRLDNGKYLAVSMDGNPRHCHVNPYYGAMGCFEEACRNVACLGARPVAMLDHLQFGSPENPAIFWTFLEAIRALRSYSEGTSIPCIGGKVSLYNETQNGPIKPSPVILVLGISDRKPRTDPASDGDILLILGETGEETGGSAYRHLAGHPGGLCPRVDVNASKANAGAARRLVQNDMVRAVHDCSQGGLAVAAAKLCMSGRTGCEVDIGSLPGEVPDAGAALFSESHSRYLAVVPPDRLADARGVLSEAGVPHARIGTFGGDRISFRTDDGIVASLMVDKARQEWSGALERMIQHG